MSLGVPEGVAQHAELLAEFELPNSPTVLAVTIGELGYQSSLSCHIDYKPQTNHSAPFNELPVECGSSSDTLRVLPTETSISLRVFLDATFIEAFFQRGRVAITEVVALTDATQIAITASADAKLRSAVVYPIKSIWVSPEEVRNAPRVYK